VDAGAVAFKVVALTKVTLVALFAPKVTVAPVTKLVPVIVMTLPPAGAIVVGEICVMVGVWAWARDTKHMNNIGTISAVMRRTVLLDFILDALFTVVSGTSWFFI
jgi:hypothetical protein